jgi:hypothetical protein
MAGGTPRQAIIRIYDINGPGSGVQRCDHEPGDPGQQSGGLLCVRSEGEFL